MTATERQPKMALHYFEIMNTFINQGWECPKCGSVYAPTVTKCFNCPVQVTTSPYTTTTLPEWAEKMLRDDSRLKAEGKE